MTAKIHSFVDAAIERDHLNVEAEQMATCIHNSYPSVNEFIGFAAALDWIAARETDELSDWVDHPDNECIFNCPIWQIEMDTDEVAEAKAVPLGVLLRAAALIRAPIDLAIPIRGEGDDIWRVHHMTTFRFAHAKGYAEKSAFKRCFTKKEFTKINRNPYKYAERLFAALVVIDEDVLKYDSRIDLIQSQFDILITVRLHINWNKHGPDLKEDLAHLFQDIKRRICGVASAGFPSFSV